MTGDFTALAANQTMHLPGGTTVTGFESFVIQTVSDTASHTITALNGDDFVTTAGGNDVIIGNGGNDILDAGTGQDSLYGGAGDDALSAREGGRDRIDGGIGTDTVYLYRMSETADLTLNITGPNALLTGGTVIRGGRAVLGPIRHRQ